MYYTVYLPILPQVRRAIILYHSLLGMYKLYYTIRVYILGILYSLLMSELDINDQKANRQNNPEGGNNAQCHVYSHVDSIGHDAGYGLIFGRVWSRPINVRTAF